MSELTKGRWKNTELEFMKKHAATMPVVDIAAALHRDVNTVALWIRNRLALDVSGDEPVAVIESEIRNELRASPDWLELKDQFVESELKRFEYKYAKLVAQFNNDVTPTEDGQIFMLIKFDILISRNLKNRQRAIIDIERIENELDDIRTQHAGEVLDQQTKDRIVNLESQLQGARRAEETKTVEIVKLTEKYNSMLVTMKATRDQRFDKVEKSRESFLGLLKGLQEEEIRKEAGADIALMQMAVDTEKTRLTKPHRYMDDTIDVPLLTPEGVEDEEKGSDSGE